MHVQCLVGVTCSTAGFCEALCRIALWEALWFKMGWSAEAHHRVQPADKRAMGDISISSCPSAGECRSSGVRSGDRDARPEGPQEAG